MNDLFEIDVITAKPSEVNFRPTCTIPGCDKLCQNHSGGAQVVWKRYCSHHHQIGAAGRAIAKAQAIADRIASIESLSDEPEKFDQDELFTIDGESLIPKKAWRGLRLIENETQENKSFIYFLFTADGKYVKIGYAANTGRIYQLDRIYNFDFTKSYILEVNTAEKKIHHVEKALHTVFGEFREPHPDKKDGYTEFFKTSIGETSIRDRLDETMKIMFRDYKFEVLGIKSKSDSEESKLFE